MANKILTYFLRLFCFSDDWLVQMLHAHIDEWNKYLVNYTIILYNLKASSKIPTDLDNLYRLKALDS